MNGEVINNNEKIKRKMASNKERSNQRISEDGN